MVIAAVAEVGTALSIVGAVTGNKDLMKIGGIMSLVGGIGSIAAGAAGGASGVATEALTDAATNTALDAASDTAMNAFGGEAAANAATDSVVAGMENAATESLAPALSAAAPTGPASLAGPTANASQTTAGASSAGTPSATTASTATDPNAVAGAQGPQTPAGAQGPSTPTSPSDVSRIPSARVAPQSADSMFGKFMKFANDNSKLISTGMQFVGGAMNGASQRDMFDQRLALDREAVNQRGYGNSIANYTPQGIIAGAR